MSTIDPDATPPEGLPTQSALPAEADTSPELPAAQVKCFMCLGAGLRLKILRRHPDGGVLRAEATTCSTCRGTKTVSRRVWAAWHAARFGR